MKLTLSPARPSAGYVAERVVRALNLGFVAEIRRHSVVRNSISSRSNKFSSEATASFFPRPIDPRPHSAMFIDTERYVSSIWEQNGI